MPIHWPQRRALPDRSRTDVRFSGDALALLKCVVRAQRNVMVQVVCRAPIPEGEIAYALYSV